MSIFNKVDHKLMKNLGDGHWSIHYSRGVDVIPLLEAIGAGETVIGAFQTPGVGNAAVAYLLYKVATPARYTVTILGTQLTVRMMRKMGYWEPVPKQDSIRQLYKEGREEFKERMEAVRDKYDEHVEDIRDRYEDQVDETKTRLDKYKGKYEEFKTEIKEKYKDMKDEVDDSVKDKKR